MFSFYIEGGCSVRDLIDASKKQLRLDIKAGPGRHASAYDARIAEIKDKVQLNFNHGLATQSDLDQVLDARVDVLLAPIVLAPDK